MRKGSKLPEKNMRENLRDIFLQGAADFLHEGKMNNIFFRAHSHFLLGCLRFFSGTFAILSRQFRDSFRAYFRGSFCWSFRQVLNEGFIPPKSFGCGFSFQN